MSLSKYLGELLKQQMEQDASYEAAMRRYLSLPPRELKSEPEPFPRREELHERPGGHPGQRPGLR